MTRGRVFLVGGELRCGRCDAVADRISDKTRDTEGGLIFLVLGGRKRRLIGFAASHVVARYLRSVGGLAVLQVEHTKNILYILRSGELDVFERDCDGYSCVLRDRRLDSNVP